jgi:Rod binding domain-containing protein
MEINSTNPFALFNQQAAANATLPSGLNNLGSGNNIADGNDLAGNEKDETREAFDKFVGGTFYRQMLSEMQKSVGKPAFLHGGQAEEMFRSELNSQLADKMAESSGKELTNTMYELFNLQRS